jgi:hypothetical protein
MAGPGPPSSQELENCIEFSVLSSPTVRNDVSQKHGRNRFSNTVQIHGPGRVFQKMRKSSLYGLHFDGVRDRKRSVIEYEGV